MKLRIQPVRQMKKGKTKVWVNCTAECAQAYAILDHHNKVLRREQSHAEAQRVVQLFSKPRSQPVKDRRTLVGKRWADVKEKL